MSILVLASSNESNHLPCLNAQQVALAVDDSINSPASLEAGDAVPGVVCPNPEAL